MERIILHSDFNSFYASVECMLNPEIASRPVAVAGSAEKRHGIILAKNGIAKEYGIATGEPIWSAKKKCPDLHIVPPHFDRYLEYSRAAFKLYNSYTPRVEPYGLDECWLDISAPDMTIVRAEKFADELRQHIKNQFGITVSIGVSFTKSFAKLASDLKKPDAVSVISHANYKEKVWSLPCEELLYVGRSTRQRLNSHGIYTIGDIARMPVEILHDILGKSGVMLHDFATGNDPSEVAYAATSSESKSIGNSTTTSHDLTTFDEAHALLYSLADKVSLRLRQADMRCMTVKVSVRDKNLITSEKQIKLPSATNISNEIAEAAIGLFNKHYDPRRTPIRALGVHTTQLVPASDGFQTNLFEDIALREKQMALEHAKDNLTAKYGNGIVSRASGVDLQETHAFLRKHSET